jgi:hypothetical protein
MRAAAAALGLLLVACGSTVGPAASPSPSATAALDSGIDAYTVSGPTCPVQREGQNCTAPISATVVVARDDGTHVAQVHTSSDGRGHIPLPPGTYTLVGTTGGRPFPRAPAPQKVAVSPHQFVAVQLTFDTGIR